MKKILNIFLIAIILLTSCSDSKEENTRLKGEDTVFASKMDSLRELAKEQYLPKEKIMLYYKNGNITEERKIVYGYDREHNLLIETDYSTYFNGCTSEFKIEYVYDENNRIIERISSGIDVFGNDITADVDEYIYNDNGMYYINDDGLEYHYNERGQLIKECLNNLTVILTYYGNGDKKMTTTNYNVNGKEGVISEFYSYLWDVPTKTLICFIEHTNDEKSKIEYIFDSAGNCIKEVVYNPSDEVECVIETKYKKKQIYEVSDIALEFCNKAQGIWIQDDDFIRFNNGEMTAGTLFGHSWYVGEIISAEKVGSDLDFKIEAYSPEYYSEMYGFYEEKTSYFEVKFKENKIKIKLLDSENPFNFEEFQYCCEE